MKTIRVFAPATIANLGAGFDNFGLALEGLGDEMEFSTTEKQGVSIVEITGAELSKNPAENVVGVAAQAVLDILKPKQGVAIKIHKGIKPGSGLGSSAASASGAAFGVASLFEADFTNELLIQCALKGEALASGAIHADNVAPALLGGAQFVQNHEAGKTLSIEYSTDLHFVVLHPQVEIKTSDARKVVPTMLPTSEAINQAGNFAALCLGLKNGNEALLKKGLTDYIATPYRKDLIPSFENMRNAALAAGAIGTGISGSGPTTFYLCSSEAIAQKVALQISTVFEKENIDFYTHISPIAALGAKLI